MKVVGLVFAVIALVALCITLAGFGLGVSDVLNTVAPETTEAPVRGVASIVDLYYYGQVAGQYVTNLVLAK